MNGSDPCDTLHAAAVFAVDPQGLGGVCLRAAPGPARDAWLQALATLLGSAPRRVPVHVDDQRLLGGLDLTATLQAGRPVQQRGLLGDSDGGVLLLAMAERCSPALAARLAAVLDTGQVQGAPARLAIVALDEGLADDEQLPAVLAERLALQLRLQAVPPPAQPWDIAAARARLPQVQADAAIVQALCEAAQALGITTLRAPWLAWRTACAAAALDGRLQVEAADAALAARWVLAPRSRTLPAPPEAQDQPPEQPPPPPPSDDSSAEQEAEPEPDMPLSEQVLEAALSRLPPDLLQALQAAGAPRRGAASAGRSGAAMRSRLRGRPIGSERGDPRSGARLDLLATLRCAAPWQSLRRRETARDGLQLRRDDFRVRRYREQRETTTIFAVDASGSAALHRLAEAKGAVELLLAECYVRRDKVALLSFRGQAAELLLPPTRSLPRARRCLAALPGGGGTPLAAGIAGAQALAEGLLRGGGSASLVLLTDGRANVSRDGSPGREAAQQDALAAARALRAAGVAALLLDTAPQPQPAARTLADTMGASYLALPHADAAQISRAVSTALVSR